MGVLDVPDLFLDPCRVQAALIWFGRGYVEYKFPNNAKVLKSGSRRSNSRWNCPRRFPAPMPTGRPTSRSGSTTSRSEPGPRRGITAIAAASSRRDWWKLEGSQYGALTRWHVSSKGTFVGAKKLSAVTLADLRLAEHHSIRLRVGIDENAEHPGGVNIFGRGFGNHDQDIVMRLHLK